MRTDAKIGFAIVGVLLAVLVVYAVVIPRHKRAPQQALTPPVTVKVLPDTADHVDVPPAKPDAQPSVVTPPPAHPGDPIAATKPGGDEAVARNDSANSLAGPTAPPFTPGLPDLTLPDPPVKVRPHVPDRHDTVSAHNRHRPSVNVQADRPGVATVSAERAYTVRPGQTLSSIAGDLYGDPHAWVQIQKANPKLNPSRLKVGTKIMVPDPTAIRPHPAVVVPAADVIMVEDGAELSTPPGQTYVVKPGDSLYKIAKRFLGSGRRADALFELNRSEIGSSPSRLRQGMVLRLPSAAGALSDAMP